MSVLSSFTYASENIRDAMLSEVRGQVTVRENGKEWKAAMPGIVLHEKDEIRTGANGYAEILMDGGDTASLELKENSYFKFHTLGVDSTGDKSTLLDLAIGKVLVHAEKLKNNSKFEVRTPTSTTGVRGTMFEVQVEEQK